MKKAVSSLMIIVLSAFIIFQVSCVKDVGPLPRVAVSPTFCDSANVKFSTDINPIIQANCAVFGCHDATTAQNGYDFSQGYSSIDTARIRARVLDGAINGWMPQAGPLPLLDRQKIECWLKDGAPNN
jgi:hypothetical protein